MGVRQIVFIDFIEAMLYFLCIPHLQQDPFIPNFCCRALNSVLAGGKFSM